MIKKRAVVRKVSVARPFVKWAGGKGQLLKEIRKKYPCHIQKYCEPFVGGGAVLFDVLNKFQPRKVLINDINKELINVYAQIKNACHLLIEKLVTLQFLYQAKQIEERKVFFYEKRERYNNIKLEKKEKDNIEKAALFIFLNKTCFNGLYRVNSRGLFNVPYNNANNPLLCDKENLLTCSKLLENVEIKAGDYQRCENFIDENTFVYIDPPYRPITKTARFTAYSKKEFSDREQIELSQFIAKIAKKGAMFLLSNSDPKNANSEDDFFDLLYSHFEITRIKASRMINAASEKRGKITELLISNVDK